MRRDGTKLLLSASNTWSGGSDTFFFKGGSGRWRDVLSAEEVALYHKRAKEKFQPGLAAWIDGVRLPRSPRRSLTLSSATHPPQFRRR
jgi:hypothetical protein